MAPFALFPVVSACETLLAKVVTHLPLLSSVWPLVLLTVVGAVVAGARSLVFLRRERVLLAACREPDASSARLLAAHVERLRQVAGLREAPRVLVYPRGAHVCSLGARKPTIVISQDLLPILSDEELEAVLAH